MPKLKDSVDLQFPKFDEELGFDSCSTDVCKDGAVTIRFHGVPKAQLRRLASITKNKVIPLSTCISTHINLTHNISIVFFS